MASALGVAVALVIAWSLLAQLRTPSADDARGPTRPSPERHVEARPCAGPDAPTDCLPEAGDRHGHLLHARWVAAWSRAQEALERLERCREARAASGDDAGCDLDALERAHACACEDAARARSAYLGHLAR